jgi:hypothetical protein
VFFLALLALFIADATFAQYSRMAVADQNAVIGQEMSGSLDGATEKEAVESTRVEKQHDEERGISLQTVQAVSSDISEFVSSVEGRYYETNGQLFSGAREGPFYLTEMGVLVHQTCGVLKEKVVRDLFQAVIKVDACLNKPEEAFFTVALEVFSALGVSGSSGDTLKVFCDPAFDSRPSNSALMPATPVPGFLLERQCDGSVECHPADFPSIAIYPELVHVHSSMVQTFFHELIHLGGYFHSVNSLDRPYACELMCFSDESLVHEPEVQIARRLCGAAREYPVHNPDYPREIQAVLEALGHSYRSVYGFDLFKF